MISFKVRNIAEIKEMIDELPRAARGIASRDVAFYLMGNEMRGLKHYPAQRPGTTYKRTYNLRFGWQASDWSDGAQIKIENAVPYAPFVQGDDTQAWMHVGWWRTVSQIIESNMTGALRAVEQSLARWIKAHEKR